MMVKIVDHGTWSLAAADEDLHAPGPELLWNESYYFDFAAADGSVGGYIRLGLYPNWERAWYWACVVRPGLPAILVADNAAALPRPGETELRADGYHATQVISEPAALRSRDADRDRNRPARARRGLQRAQHRDGRPRPGPGVDDRRRRLPV